MTGTPKVALLVETASSYGRGLLRGIARYARLNGPWAFFIEPGGQEDAPPPLRDWGVDGVIALFRTKRQAERILAAGLPTVDLDFTLPDLAPCGVRNDEEGIARMAATHLLSRGLRHFAYTGWPLDAEGASLWDTTRRLVFAETIAKHDFQTDVYEWPASAEDRVRAREQEPLAAWLKSLPKPAGLMACNDQRARHVLEAARLAGLRVPEDLAVIGVDNDETLCELSTPSITSIAPNTDHLGFKGAEMLDRLMKGRRVTTKPMSVPALGVIARRSTDQLAMADTNVVAAVRFMEANIDKPIRISEVLRVASVCRKTLEMRFQRALGRTPHEELQRLRLERVKHLLLQTAWPLKRIAKTSGFTYVEHLHLTFRRATGTTPTRFRARHGGLSRFPVET
jgi:LacI family transcriptional regulator